MMMSRAIYNVVASFKEKQCPISNSLVHILHHISVIEDDQKDSALVAVAVNIISVTIPK